MHKEAVAKLAAKSSSANIALQLHTQSKAEQEFHGNMLLSSIRFLARQGLPLRGHTETSDSFEGNLYQLLLLRAEGNDMMSAWLRRKEYLYPDIMNEIIVMMGKAVLRKILTQIKGAMWFALIADEASHKEQMCLSIRWINSSYEIYE